MGYTPQELVEVRKEKFIKGDGWIYPNGFDFYRVDKHFKYYLVSYVEWVNQIQNLSYHFFMTYLKEGSKESKLIEKILIINRGLYFNNNVDVDTHFKKVEDELKPLISGRFITERISLILTKLQLLKISSLNYKRGCSEEYYRNNPSKTLSYDEIKKSEVFDDYKVDEGEFNE